MKAESHSQIPPSNNLFESVRTGRFISVIDPPHQLCIGRSHCSAGSIEVAPTDQSCQAAVRSLRPYSVLAPRPGHEQKMPGIADFGAREGSPHFRVSILSRRLK